MAEDAWMTGWSYQDAVELVCSLMGRFIAACPRVLNSYELMHVECLGLRNVM